MKTLSEILDYTHERFDTVYGEHLGRAVTGHSWNRTNIDGMDLMLETTRAGRWFLADFYRRPEYAPFADLFDGTESSNPTLHGAKVQALTRALEIVKTIRPGVSHEQLKRAVEAERHASA
ncbi:hypothetical protein [Burkholderia sp. Ac-20365]|uniref:hypothetical protein n=1 Tax=Burkholderia sp. Ac-20365 TaxID=2703897 RepID=UPI00197C1A73|nr:hypothetical protein [Burkholderia sp. Ac-20365]MBN3761231.1 hypothetical protein [Burkholderia sp. Ac-20365]